MGLAYETMAAYDTQPGSECAVELRPLLAEGWRFASPTTVELSIKKGVRFHNKPPVNGREAVAEDVVFSYRRLLDQGLQKLTGENIVSIEAVDRYTVRIRTKEPAPLITQELFARYEVLILAKEAGGPEGKFDTLKTVIGTGPFVLQSYTPGVNFVAVRNPDYRVAGRPYLDELRVPIMRDKNTRVAAFQVGKLDYLEDMESDEVEGLAARNPTIRFVPCENPSSYGLMLRNDIRPFNDVRVRRAISMAFDREGIVKGVFRGQGNVRGVAAHFAEGTLKPGDFPPETRKYLEYNPAEARRLLADAGYPTGLDLEIFGSLFHGSPFSQQVEILPAMLRPAGFNVRLVLGDITAYQAAVNSWNYGPAGVMMVSAFPLEELLPQFHSQQGPNNNRPALKDPALDALIGRMLSTVDAKERIQVMKQIQLRMVDQAYWVAYPTFYSYYGIRPRLKGNLRANALVGAGAEAPRGMMFVDAWVAD
jgi:peptide/nickel transport system substrate-binding protein